MEEKDTKYFYDQAKYLVNVRKKSPQDAVNDLVAEGLDEESAIKMVNYASGAGANAEDNGGESGVKDMLIGDFFCVVGTIATVADIGYIFWGAIVFGGIQFIKGLSKSLS